MTHIRITSLAAALLLFMVALVASSPAQADVPDDWGDPVVEFGLVEVMAHDVGRLPGRLGNQHVNYVSTVDEESVVSGQVLDWWCPPGVIAPENPAAQTTCRLKAQSWISYDWPRPPVARWSPRLRWMTLRIPIALADNAGTVARHGTLSLHLKATGELTHTWYEGDYLDTLSRDQARVVGGTFMGRAWLRMSQVDVTEDGLSLLRYYDPTPPSAS